MKTAWWDDDSPKLSDTCPDCGSSNWKPITYGLPAQATQEAARRREVLLGGCRIKDARRYCFGCFNHWPTKPNGSKPAGLPEYIQRRVDQSLSEYARLAALAELPASPEEPHVERAWARIDRSLEFLISFENRRTRLAKKLDFARLGGAPVYRTVFGWYPSKGVPELLMGVAARRFERSRQPEKHNLYNDWDKIQAERRDLERSLDENAILRLEAAWSREELGKLLRLAQRAPDILPDVVSVKSSRNEKKFLVRFPWGAIPVRKYRSSSLEPTSYECRVPAGKTEDAGLAENLARAAAMLADFPRLAWYVRARTQ